MAMPGTGCFVAIHDLMRGREADYENWHTHEHMIERLAIPGFLRGLRYRAVTQSDHHTGDKDCRVVLPHGQAVTS